MKLSSRKKLLDEADEVISDLKDQIKSIPELESLVKKVRTDPKYKNYNDEELEQMLVPWFIVNYNSKMVQLSLSSPWMNDGPSRPPKDMDKPYTYYYLSQDDKKRISNALERLRKAALRRKDIEDIGQEPPGGYDQDLALQKKQIILSKGMDIYDSESFMDRVRFWWKKSFNDNAAFFDWRTGVAYNTRGEPISGNSLKMILDIIIKNVNREKNDNVDKAVSFLEDMRTFWNIRGRELNK